MRAIANLVRRCVHGAQHIQIVKEHAVGCPVKGKQMKIRRREKFSTSCLDEYVSEVLTKF